MPEAVWERVRHPSLSAQPLGGHLQAAAQRVPSSVLPNIIGYEYGRVEIEAGPFDQVCGNRRYVAFAHVDDAPLTALRGTARLSP